MPFVVDNSVVIGWHFTGQATPYTEAVLDRLADDTAHVPALWALEFSNVIRKAVAGKQITEARARDIMQFQAGLSVVVHDDVPDPAENMALALRYGLTSYDAAYLELALRLHLQIAAKDGALCDAARAAGIILVTPLEQVAGILHRPGHKAMTDDEIDAAIAARAKANDDATKTRRDDDAT